MWIITYMYNSFGLYTQYYIYTNLWIFRLVLFVLLCISNNFIIFMRYSSCVYNGPEIAMGNWIFDGLSNVVTLLNSLKCLNGVLIAGLYTSTWCIWSWFLSPRLSSRFWKISQIIHCMLIQFFFSLQIIRNFVDWRICSVFPPFCA